MDDQKSPAGTVSKADKLKSKSELQKAMKEASELEKRLEDDEALRKRESMF